LRLINPDSVIACAYFRSVVASKIISLCTPSATPPR
jgi:hypothetical protein